MHMLKVRRPRPELRPYVRTFAQRNISSTSPVVVEPTTAQLEQHLTFDFGTPVEVWYPDGRNQWWTQPRQRAHKLVLRVT
jgi:hypothetical protein